MAEAKNPSLLRRLVRYGLPSVGVLVCGTGLYVGYCERQTQATVAQLRALNVRVESRDYLFPWWARLSSTAGLSPKALPFSRRQFQVIVNRPADSAATLRLVARLPEVRILVVNNAPDLDDAALGLVKDCTSIELLGLHNTSVTDEGIRHLAKWDRLYVVSVTYSRVTDASTPFLKSLPSMWTVKIVPALR